MKKSIITAAMLLSCICNSIAQQALEGTDNRERFQFGLKAGLNYSNVYDEKGDEFNAEAKFGLAAGGFISIPFGKYLGIQPGVMLSQKGFKASGVLLGDPYAFTRTTTYIDVPLLFALKPSEFFTLVAGPQFSYLANQRDNFSSSVVSYSQEQEFKNDNIRKNIFGMVAGVDINMKHITLGARACWDVQDNHGDGISTSPRYKNVWFQGTVGYLFYKN